VLQALVRLTFQKADSAVFVVDWGWEGQVLAGLCAAAAPAVANTSRA
jgi:hypothetical protein